MQLYQNLFRYLSLHNLFHLVHDELIDEANMCNWQGQEEHKSTWCTTFSWTFYEEYGRSCTKNPNLSSPEYLWQGEISVCKVLVPIIFFIQNSNCIYVGAWMGFCIGTVFTEKNMLHILVKSLSSGKYQPEFDTIFLQ